MARKIDEDDLTERWTLVGDELAQVAGKRGATRLGFSLLLRFYAELSVAEIAEALGCRPGSVGPWINRGLQRMRKALS